MADRVYTGSLHARLSEFGSHEKEVYLLWGTEMGQSISGQSVCHLYQVAGEGREEVA